MKTRAQRAQEAAQEQEVLIGTPDIEGAASVDSGYSTDSTMGDKKTKGFSHYMPADQLEPAGDDYTALDVLTFRCYGGNAGTKVGEHGDSRPGIKFAFFFVETTLLSHWILHVNPGVYFHLMRIQISIAITRFWPPKIQIR
mmetsp:Transcript_40190/g.60293  ORF Transcript_40190/g.60293 Transcript_40190/m.60293 type:complete len:141 (-) Transcript_40190:40-462(-)